MTGKLINARVIKDPEKIKMPSEKNSAIHFAFFKEIPDMSTPKEWKIRYVIAVSNVFSLPFSTSIGCSKCVPNAPNSTEKADNKAPKIMTVLCMISGSKYGATNAYHCTAIG